MIVNEYLHNLYYDIYKGYPLIIFNEVSAANGQKKFTFTTITKVKYDKKNKILFLIQNKENYLYIPLDKAGNANSKFFNDLIELNADTIIVSSKKNLIDILENNIENIEIDETLTGKKVPIEFFIPSDY